MAKEKKEEVVETGTGHAGTCVCMECRTYVPTVSESK